MALQSKDLGSTGEANTGDEDIHDLIKCLLSHFSIISKTRLHNLSFLSEYEYWSDNSRRLTSAHYRPYLQGCYSEEIEVALSGIDGVVQKSVRVGGEKVTVVKTTDDLDCSLGQDATELVNEVVNEFGEETPEEVQETILNLDVYSDTPSDDYIDFSP